MKEINLKTIEVNIETKVKKCKNFHETHVIVLVNRLAITVMTMRSNLINLSTETKKIV